MAQGSQTGLRLIEEATYGTTPTTPTMTPIRNNGGNGIQVSRSTIVSDEMRTDRQIPDVSLGNFDASLEIPVEFIYGAFDDLLESAFFAEWVTGTPDTLKNGTTLKSFSIEEAQTDISVFKLMTGAAVNRLSLSIQPDSTVSGTFNLRGKNVVVAAATAADTVAAANTNSPIESFNATIKIDGATAGYVVGLDLTLANSLEPKFVVGSKQALRMRYGRCNVTGSLNISFEDDTYLDMWLNGTEMALSFELTDGTNTYTFDVPRIKFTSESPNVIENDINHSYGFQALMGAGDYTIQVTR